MVVTPYCLDKENKGLVASMYKGVYVNTRVGHLVTVLVPRVYDDDYFLPTPPLISLNVI